MKCVKGLLFCCIPSKPNSKSQPENVENEFIYNNASEKLINRDERDDGIRRRQETPSINEIEIEQSLAAAISDRATDEVLEALTRYRRGLGIADSPSVFLDEPQTPDIVRSRSSHDSDGMILRPGRGIILPKLGLESPTATPHMPAKRRSTARKVRPQSVVENLSLSHIPDLLESPSSHRSNSSQQISPHDSHAGGIDHSMGGGAAGGADNSSLAGIDRADDECCDSITELPSASLQLQHLVKGRPKRAKTRAPTRPLVAEAGGGVAKEIGEGLEQFFRPGSVTPTTLTPLVSPTSEECSSLSFVDSPTMSRDGNGHMTSEETTPILEERKPIKLERSSPLLRGAVWATRSRSTDNLEKYSPLVGRKSPLVKMRTESGAGGGHEDQPTTAAERLLRPPFLTRDEQVRSPSSDSIKSHTGVESSSVIVKTGNGILRTPIVLQKPRPWSVVGNEPKTGANDGFHVTESSKTTPEKLDDDCDVVPFGQNSGGSIVGITPGIALAAGGSGGGSIVGITPGAALEKKSVRELAAGLNRMELPKKPTVLPRSLLTTSNSSSSALSTISSSSSTLSSYTSSASTTTTKTTTTTTATTSITTTTKTSTTLNTTRSKAVSETNESLNKVIIIENGSNNTATSSLSSSFIANEIKSNGNSKSNGESVAVAVVAATVAEKRNSDHINVKRIAGKEISALFEETLVEGLQRSSVRRTFRDTQYTKEDVVDL